MAWTILRTVVEETDVSPLIDHFTRQFPRFDEAWVGLQWLLARNPRPQGCAAREVDGVYYSVYVAAGDEVAGTPDIWILYTFDNAEVVIVDVSANARTKDTEH